MRNVTMKGNEASSGGAVFVTDDVVLQLETCQLRDNVASDDGGALFALGRSVLNVGLLEAACSAFVLVHIAVFAGVESAGAGDPAQECYSYEF